MVDMSALDLLQKHLQINAADSFTSSQPPGECTKECSQKMGLGQKRGERAGVGG